MLSFKSIAKYATQMAVSIYVNRAVHKVVGQLFDQVFEDKKGKMK